MGVTLGAGYDMGGRSSEEIQADLVAIGVDPAIAGSVSRAAGLKGADAAEFVRQNPTLIRLTEEQQRGLFQRSIGSYEAAVRRGVTTPINQNQFDAMVSLTYNIGTGNFGSSTLLRNVNARNFPGAAGQFDLWVRSRGEVMPGLVTRRARERQLFERSYGAR